MLKERLVVWIWSIVRLKINVLSLGNHSVAIRYLLRVPET
jgi:hypothetical protein